MLVGPNGAGKSNLMEAVSLLQSAPGDLFSAMRTGGGIGEWLWKGSQAVESAEIEAAISYPQGGVPLLHRLAFTMVGQHAQVTDEAIEDFRKRHGNAPDAWFYYGGNGGRAVLKGRTGEVQPRDLAPDQSVLSQRKDPEQYPEITYLGSTYSRIKFFRDWNLGRNAPPRRPQPADLPADVLLEDASNLPLVLNDLEHRSTLRPTFLERLKDADESIENLSTRVLGGTIQLFLHYAGLSTPIPATRVSDGTIRYLCLLAVLCHPDPPPLVCLEEPELGLHPDLLPRLADLLVEASHRMQLIVTTHSDTLVDGLTETPDAMVVCEKHRGSTVMTRKSRAELAQWLRDFGLGQLWRRGEIGGNRW